MTTKVTAAMLAADVEEKIDALIASAISDIPPPVIPSAVPAGSGFEWYGAALPMLRCLLSLEPCMVLEMDQPHSICQTPVGALQPVKTTWGELLQGAWQSR